MGAERRQHEREPWPINKTVQGEVHVGESGPRSVFLHLVDISRGGLGVNCPHELPPEDEFRMIVPLDGFGTPQDVLDVRCRVAWRKYLMGGTWNHGLIFTEATDDLRATVNCIIDAFSQEGKRRRFRLNRVLPVAVREAEGIPWLAERYASGLTPDTVAIRLERPLSQGQTVQVRLSLEFGLPTLLVKATVQSAEELAPGRVQLELAFQDLKAEESKALRSYIDRCLASR